MGRGKKLITLVVTIAFFGNSLIQNSGVLRIPVAEAAGPGIAQILAAKIERTQPTDPPNSFYKEYVNGIATTEHVEIFVQYKNNSLTNASSPTIVVVTLPPEIISIAGVDIDPNLTFPRGSLSPTNTPPYQGTISDIVNNKVTIVPSTSLISAGVDAIYIDAIIGDIPNTPPGNLKDKFDVDVNIDDNHAIETGDTSVPTNTIWFNRAPVIDDADVTQPTPGTILNNATISVDPGESVQFTLNPSDPDGVTSFTFEEDGVPPGATFSTSTGTFNWTAPDGDVVMDFRAVENGEPGGSTGFTHLTSPNFHVLIDYLEPADATLAVVKVHEGNIGSTDYPQAHRFRPGQVTVDGTASTPQPNVTYLWTDLSVSDTRYDSMNISATEAVASNFEINGVYGEQYKVRLLVTNPANGETSTVDRIILMAQTPAPPALDLLASTSCPSDPAGQSYTRIITQNQNDYVTQTATNVKICGRVESGIDWVRLYRGDSNIAIAEVTPSNDLQRRFVFPIDNTGLNTGENRFTVKAFRDTTPGAAARLNITKDSAAPALVTNIHTPAGIRFPYLLGSPSSYYTENPVSSVSGQLMTSQPGVTTKIYVLVTPCTTTCPTPASETYIREHATRIGSAPASGEFNVLIPPLTDSPQKYQLELVFEKNTGATGANPTLIGPFEVQPAPYVNVSVRSQVPASPASADALQNDSDHKVDTTIAVPTSLARVIKSVQMFTYQNDTQLPPRIIADNLNNSTHEAPNTYFTSANGWTDSGTINAATGTITWTPPTVPDGERRFVALGFRITYRNAGEPTDKIFNLIHQSNGAYYPYIIDMTEGGDSTLPRLESVNGVNITDEGQDAPNPALIPDVSDPSPVFSGSDPVGISLVGDKIGISIYAVEDNGTIVTGAPLAVERNVTMQSTGRWTWHYTHAEQVHPLEIGQLYCMRVYRVGATGDTNEAASGCSKYIKFELAADRAVSIQGSFVPSLPADCDSDGKLEARLTDRFGNVIIADDDTTITMTDPYLRPDEVQNIDVNQIDPDFTDGATTTTSVLGDPLVSFTVNGSGRLMTHEARISSCAPTLDLRREVGGVPNPNFGQPLRQTVAYGLTVTITDIRLADRGTAGMSGLPSGSDSESADGLDAPLVDLGDGVYWNTVVTARPLQLYFIPALSVQIDHLIRQNDVYRVDQTYLIDGEERIQFVKGGVETFRVTMANVGSNRAVVSHLPDTLALKALLDFVHRNASFENAQVIGARKVTLAGIVTPIAYSSAPLAGETEYHASTSEPDKNILDPGDYLEIDVSAEPAFRSRILTTFGSIMSNVYYTLTDGLDEDTYIAHPAGVAGLQVLNPEAYLTNPPAEPTTTAASLDDVAKEIERNVAKATRDASQQDEIDALKNPDLENNADTYVIGSSAVNGSGKRVMSFEKLTRGGTRTAVTAPEYENGAVYYFEDTNVILEKAAGDPYLRLPDTDTTIIVRGGNVIINDDLVKSGSASFGIIVLPETVSSPPADPAPETDYNEGLEGGNAYIASNVTSIQSDFYLKGALLRLDTELSDLFDLTSLGDSLFGDTDESYIFPEQQRTEQLLHQLVIQGLVAALQNTWNGAVTDRPYGEDHTDANTYVDLAKASAFSTHMEITGSDVDGDGVLEKTPNDLVLVGVGTTIANRSFLLTGLDPDDYPDPRVSPDYNLLDPETPDYNSGVVLGRTEQQVEPAPLFVPGTSLKIEERTQRR